MYGLMGALVVTFKRFGFDLRQLLVVVALNVYVTFQPCRASPGRGISADWWSARSSARPWSTRRSARRTVWLWGTVIGVLVVLVALLVFRNSPDRRMVLRLQRRRQRRVRARALMTHRAERSARRCSHAAETHSRSAASTSVGSAPRSVRPKTSRSSSTRSTSMVVVARPSRLEVALSDRANLRPGHHPLPAEPASPAVRAGRRSAGAADPVSDTTASTTAITTPTTRSIGLLVNTTQTRRRRPRSTPRAIRTGRRAPGP